DASPSEIYALSLPDALPIYVHGLAELCVGKPLQCCVGTCGIFRKDIGGAAVTHDRCATQKCADINSRHGGGKQSYGCENAEATRSEEHTSELESRENLVCRL